MRKNYLIILAAMLLILAAVGTTAAQAGDNGKEKVRVIAHTDKEISDAVSHGCKVVRDAKTLKALVCDKDAATSLGLQEDIQVFAVDAGANTQIRADLVQASGNTGVGRKVVVLDTGYNYLHPELISSYLGGRDFVNNDGDPMDDNGHGSHVAGIITADGVYSAAKGVAPDAGIIAGKVLAANGGGYFSDVVAAIYWAVDGPDGKANTPDDFNADAISISLGTDPPYTYKGFCDNVLPDLTTAIKYATDRGVVVVVAAGNSGSSGVSIPGCISYSTTVGAVDSGDNIAYFSGIGDAVDISAPGVSLLSSWLGSSYYYASGTSMATPVVSGTVALIKFAHPDYTVAQIQNILFNNAKDLGTPGKDSTYGWGRVDAYALTAPIRDVAVTSISAPYSVSKGTPVNIGVNVANQGNQGENFTVTVTDETDSVTIGSQGVSLNAGSTTILGFNWDTSASSPGNHTIKAQASVVPGETDTADNVKTAPVYVFAPDTTPPVISNVQVSSITDSKATITWTTNEPGDSLIRYGTVTPPSGTAYASGNVTSHSITLTGLSASTTYYYEVQSTDNSGNTAIENNGGAFYSFTTLAPVIHDVAVTSISLPSSASKGTPVNIGVTVANEGNQPENFTVTVTDITDSKTIGLQGVSLLAGSFATLNFVWNTSTSSPGNHAIEARAGIVPGENDTVDNVKNAVVSIVDITSPVISTVKASNITDTKATITWATDETSDSLVRYGTTIPPSSISYALNPVTSHSITLTGLSASTTYYYEVQSTDSSGNSAVDNSSGAYYSFTTAAPAKTMHIADIVMSTTKINIKTYATATVTIVDAAGIPVQGASVRGHWSVLTSDVDSGITDINGRVALKSDQVKKAAGTFTFTVDGAVLSGWIYNPAENIKTSNSITV